MKKASRAGRWHPHDRKAWDACQLGVRQMGEFLRSTEEKQGSPHRRREDNFKFYNAVLSPESTRGLNRHKKRVQNSMTDLEDRISSRDTKEAGRPTYTQIGKEINDVETDMEDVVQLYAKVRDKQTATRTMEDRRLVGSGMHGQLKCARATKATEDKPQQLV